MELLLCTKEDFLTILNELPLFWGSNRTIEIHHPMFIHEFGNSAFVFKEGKEIIAYLFGFLSQTEPLGYIHVVAVKEGYRKLGLGERLYGYFIDYARENGCKKIKAITTPANEASKLFHEKIGMKLLGEMNNENVVVVKNYSGYGNDRIVFEKEI